MEKQEYFNIYNLEKNHWWYKGMRYLSFNLLRRYVQGNKNKILDVGCGTGLNLTHLKEYGDVFGIDNSKYAIELCKRRKLKVKKASVEKLPFKKNTFDVITCFEVIYHKDVKSDLNALKEINRTLKNNGVLLIRVPAYKSLLSGHDKVVHTKRRYQIDELRSKLIKSNFKIEKISYVNSILFPLVFSLRKLNNLINTEETNIKETNPIINSLFFNILKIESKMLNLMNFPFGVSIIAIARKIN